MVGEVKEDIVVGEVKEDLLLGVVKDWLQVVGEVEDRIRGSGSGVRGQAVIGVGSSRG